MEAVPRGARAGVSTVAVHRVKDGAGAVADVLAGMSARRNERIAAARARTLEVAARERYAGPAVLRAPECASAADALPLSRVRLPSGKGASDGPRGVMRERQRKKQGTNAGRGKAWTRDERVDLCRAVRKAALNGLLAADQQNEDHWGKVLFSLA